MTGEITLSGLVLPVGGIREKALAARRHGIKTFILPARNEADIWPSCRRKSETACGSSPCRPWKKCSRSRSRR